MGISRPGVISMSQFSGFFSKNVLCISGMARPLHMPFRTKSNATPLKISSVSTSSTVAPGYCLISNPVYAAPFLKSMAVIARAVRTQRFLMPCYHAAVYTNSTNSTRNAPKAHSAASVDDCAFAMASQGWRGQRVCAVGLRMPHKSTYCALSCRTSSVG